MLINVLPAFIAAAVMLIESRFLPIGQSVCFNIASISVAIVTYFAIVLMFKKERHYLLNIKAILKGK
jgi:hypothetical protein